MHSHGRYAVAQVAPHDAGRAPLHRDLMPPSAAGPRGQRQVVVIRLCPGPSCRGRCPSAVPGVASLRCGQHVRADLNSYSLTLVNCTPLNDMAQWNKTRGYGLNIQLQDRKGFAYRFIPQAQTYHCVLAPCALMISS